MAHVKKVSSRMEAGAGEKEMLNLGKRQISERNVAFLTLVEGQERDKRGFRKNRHGETKRLGETKIKRGHKREEKRRLQREKEVEEDD